MILGWEPWWHALVALGAAAGGGALNALAGGGTLLTFPTLLWFGLLPVAANVTSAVSLWPGSLGAAWGFRREIMAAERWWLWLAVPSLAGGMLGAILLMNLPSRIFSSIAPYLVLGTAAVMVLERPIESILHGQAS